MYTPHEIQDYHWKAVSTRRTSFHQHNVLNLRRKQKKLQIWSIACVWCCNWDTLHSRPEIPLKFSDMVLEKDGKHQVEKLCENWRSITKNQGRNILHTRKWRKTNWIGHILHRNCILKHITEKMTVGKRRQRPKLLQDGLRKGGKKMILEFESTGSLSLKNLLQKRLCACCKTDSVMERSWYAWNIYFYSRFMQQCFPYISPKGINVVKGNNELERICKEETMV